MALAEWTWAGNEVLHLFYLPRYKAECGAKTAGSYSNVPIWYLRERLGLKPPVKCCTKCIDAIYDRFLA